MINGLNIYYSKNIGRRLKPISTNKKTANGLKPVGNKKTANGLKPVSTNKGGSCKKIGQGLRILQ